MREIRILKELKHENIVNLIEVFRWKGKIFLVFEYVPHTVLEELENNQNGLDPLEAKKYMWQLIRGTEFVHQHNVIHRDIKPENLLISKHGALKICDFGFARFLSGPDTLYTDYVSTRWYRAPELLVGDANYGRGIDIWAIGCLLAELTTGQPLFPGESDLRTLQYILGTIGGKLTDKQKTVLENNPIFTGMDAVKSCVAASTISNLEQKLPHLSSDAMDFLKSCLAIDPSERPTCSQLLRHKYFEGDHELFEQELQEMILKDAAEFQMRTKAAVSQQNSTEPADSGPSQLRSIGEDKEENSSSDNLSANLLPEDGVPHKMEAPSTNDLIKSIPPGKSVNKVTITFNKPKHAAEHSGSSNELNVSFSKKTSTKVPPGGGAGPSTMILKDLSNPLKQAISKRSFKEADFQNPPSFLKSDTMIGSKVPAPESKYGLPQLKGKNIQPATGNYPKANRLVALPQITESKGSSEKVYLKNMSPQKQDLDSSFEYKPYAQPALNTSADENSNPSMFSTSIHGNKISGKKTDLKSSIFPAIPAVHQNQNVSSQITSFSRNQPYSTRSRMSKSSIYNTI